MPSAGERGGKKRRRMEKETVVTRWACPREISGSSKCPAVPAQCSKCHGAGCSMEVFASSSAAETFVFVIDRTDKFNKYMCKACGDIFSGTQSRIVSHRLKVTGRGVQGCSSDITDDVQRVLGPLDQELSAKHSFIDKKKRTDDRKRDSQDKTRFKSVDEADVAVARFFFECGVPLSFVDHPAFARMVESVSQVGENYAPPSKLRLQSASAPAPGPDGKGTGAPGLMYACTKAVEKEQQVVLSGAQIFGGTLVSDGAKNIGNDSMMASVLTTR